MAPILSLSGVSAPYAESCDLQDYDDGRRIHAYVHDAQQVQIELAFREVVAPTWLQSCLYSC